MTVELNPTLSASLNYTNVANSAVQEANGNGVITVTGAGTKLHSKYITQNTIFDHKVFEKDYLSWLDELIDDTSDQIVICLTPQTATVAANAVIHYKDY